MASPVSLDALISSVRAVAPGEPLGQLEEAARLRDEVGELTDALLGHFVDQARRGGCSWSQIGDALGVSKQAAQQRHTGRSLPMERVTDRTRLAIEQAVAAAQARGAATVEPEHVLLGLLAVPECLAAKLLAEVGVTSEALDERLAALGRSGSAPTTAIPGFSPPAARALTGALEQSLLLGHNYIGTEHVLLALLVQPEGALDELLGDAGLTHDAAKTRIVQILTGLAAG